MIKVSMDVSDIASLIETLDSRLSNEACMELAYFLDDCYSDGIEINRLRTLASCCTEYDTAEELIMNYYPDDPYNMIREEEGDDLEDDEIEEILLRRLEEREGITILKTTDGYVCID